MYEVYQDHPKQARLNIRVVLAVAFLVCAIGAGIFLITRLVSKPPRKKRVPKPASSTIPAPLKAAGTTFRRKKLRKN